MHKLGSSRKRKIKGENMEFQDIWADKYFLWNNLIRNYAYLQRCSSGSKGKQHKRVL